MGRQASQPAGLMHEAETAFDFSRFDGRDELALAPATEEVRTDGPRLSVVIPATDGPATLDRCIDAIVAADDPPEQVIIVDDPTKGGAGGARNAGAGLASGDVLVFIDSDVIVHRDVFNRIRKAFDEDPELTGLFGSYDDDPGDEGTISAFRNLLHHHVHQSARGPMATFWAGLGAMRRSDFEAAGGFDPRNPVEDIELGMRLATRGASLRLDPALQGTHLKCWTLRGMLVTDFIVRGAPWVELMLRYNHRPRGLNVGWRHRLSALACLATVGAAGARRPGAAVSSAATFVVLNRSFYRLLLAQTGPRQACAGVWLHALHHFVGVASLPAGWVLYMANSTAPRLPIDPPAAKPVALAVAAE